MKRDVKTRWEGRKREGSREEGSKARKRRDGGVQRTSLSFIPMPHTLVSLNIDERCDVHDEHMSRIFDPLMKCEESGKGGSGGKEKENEKGIIQVARESLVVIGTQVVNGIVINVCYEAWCVIELLVLWRV